MCSVVFRSYELFLSSTNHNTGILLGLHNTNTRSPWAILLTLATKHNDLSSFMKSYPRTVFKMSLCWVPFVTGSFMINYIIYWVLLFWISRFVSIYSYVKFDPLPHNGRTLPPGTMIWKSGIYTTCGCLTQLTFFLTNWFFKKICLIFFSAYWMITRASAAGN